MTTKIVLDAVGLMDLWNECCVKLPKLLKITSIRLRKAHLRAMETPDPDVWRKVFKLCNDIPTLNGDRPNYLDLVEEDTRYEYYDGAYWHGSIAEDMSIDQCKHSVFGASKVAADIMCQEYARYWDMNIGIFRGGCLTGPNHAGAELHGFLSYLVKCMVNDKPYTIFGYKGKQVRDNIHSWDLVNMFWHYHQNPKPGEVYNAGGGRENSTSILEAINSVNKLREQDGLEPWTNYTVSSDARIGDHQWYISDLRKFKTHYPGWDITISLEETIKQIYDAEKQKVHDRSTTV